MAVLKSNQRGSCYISASGTLLGQAESVITRGSHVRGLLELPLPIRSFHCDWGWAVKQVQDLARYVGLSTGTPSRAIRMEHQTTSLIIDKNCITVRATACPSLTHTQVRISLQQGLVTSCFAAIYYVFHGLQ
jgi:hypothetical protein